MSVRPIIMSAPMVVALLEGRKTQTRRLVTPRSSEFGSVPNGKLTALYWQHADWERAWPDRGFPDPPGSATYRHAYLHVPCHDDDEGTKPCKVCEERGWAGTTHRLYPRAEPGDRLWVKETYAEVAEGRLAVFWADYPECVPEHFENLPKTTEIKWRSSLLMPRRCSRLTLEVEAVRIERLHDISREDAAAEGLVKLPASGRYVIKKGDQYLGSVSRDPREVYSWLWERINGEGSWDENPLVVVITFKVHRGNVDDRGLV